MKKILSLLFLLVLSHFSLYSQEKNQVYSDGEFYIKLKVISSQSVGKSTSDVNITSEIPLLSNYSRFNILTVKQPFYFSKNAELKRIFRVKIQSESDADKFIANIKGDSNVEYIERVPLNKVIFTPNDPNSSSLYHLNKIKAFEAWDVSRGNAEIVVAIVDDAVQTDHPDLAANCVAGWDIVDNDNDPRPPSTSYSHGTHVAGITGAVTDNAVGVSSVGFNKVKIMPIRTSYSPGYINYGYEGIAWAGSHGAKLINMSWGGGGYSITDQQVITDAYNNGAILVAAAGNSSSSSPMYPAAYENVIAVVSTNETDNISYFSNYGTWVDICAPGSNIYSTVPFNSYDTYSGTSMASPLTAGSMAFIWSNFPNLTQQELINLVKSSCDNIDSNNPSYSGLLGAGRINVYKALHCSDFSVNISPDSTIVLCQGQSQLLTATSIPDATYTWYKDSQVVSEITGNTLTVTQTGSYRVVVTKDACINSSNLVNVTFVPSSAEITSNKTPSTLCGDSLTLSTLNLPGLFYTWYKDNQVISGQNTSSLNVNATGVYKVKVEGSECDPIMSNELIVNGIEYAIDKIGPIVFCEGSTDTIKANNISGAFFQWKKNGSYIGNSNNQLVVSQTGSYKVEITTGACGTKESLPVTVSVIPNNINITTIGSPIICGAGSNKELKAPLLTGVSYQWYLNNVAISNANSNVYYATSSGNYKVLLSGPGCSKTSQPIFIEAVLVSADILPGGTTTLCQGQKIVLKTQTIPGASYQWKESTSLIGSNADSIEISTSGYYYVEIRKSTCVVNSNAKIVSVMTSTLNVVSSGSLILCPGTGVNLSVESFQFGFNFEWKKDGQQIGESFNYFYANEPGKYTVRMYNDECSIQSDSIQVILINANLTLSPSGNVNLCSGANLALNANVINNAFYKWFRNGTEISNTNTTSFTATQNGSYQVKAKVVNCDFSSNTTVFNIYSEQLLSPTDPINRVICQGDTLVVGSGLQVTNPNENQSETMEYIYSGPTVGYDGGSKSGANPSVVSTLTGNITYLKIKILWEKKGGGGATSCGVPHNGGSPYNSETQFQLSGPDGTIIMLVPGGYYGGSYGGIVTTEFADEGNIVNYGYPPTSGLFKPNQPLSNFYNKSANGTWTLLPTDLAGADPLCVSGFSIYFETGAGMQEISWWSDNTSVTGKLHTGNQYLPRESVPGTYTYYAQAQSTARCNSGRIPVTLTVLAPRPPKPTVSASKGGSKIISPITLCGGETISLSASQCQNGVIQWSTGESSSSISLSPGTNIVITAKCQKDGFCEILSESSNPIIVEVLPQNINITNDIPTDINQKFWGIQLNSTSKINSHSRIDFSATNTIILSPGFSVSAKESNNFKAYIGPCSN